MIENINSEKLAARLEPFDSYWQAPEDIASGFNKFGTFYRHNYMRHIPTDRSSRILVVSCGPGYLVKLLVDMGYQRVIGIDSAAGKIEVAVREELPCRVARAFEFLADPENVFDVIIAEQELNHLTLLEAEEFLKLCHRRLASGGSVIIYAMNGANPLVGSENLSHNIDHFFTMTETSIKQILELCEFREVEVFGLKLFVFWKNPLNYLGLAATFLMEALWKIMFRLYGKKITILEKKIAAVGKKVSLESSF